MERKTVTIEVPVTIRIVDADTGETLGEGSATISIQYYYEVPSLPDYILKGGIPGAIIAVILGRLAR